MDDAGIKVGMVCIRNFSHSMLCRIYGVVYDQIGVTDGKHIWLYWNLPTTIMSFSGEISSINILGCKIYYADLKDVYNKKLFIESISSSDPQISNISVILKRLLKIYNISNEKKSVKEMMLDLFYPPELILEDYTEVSPVCMDLVIKVMRDPPDNNVTILENKIVSLLETIESNYIDCKSLESVRRLLGMPEYNVDSDAIILLIKDNSMKKRITNIKKRIESLINGNKNIFIADFISILGEICNVLDIDNESLTKVNNETSIVVSTSDDSVRWKDKTIYLSMAGESINRLSKEEQEEILLQLSDIDPKPLRFNVLIDMITKKLYES